MLYDSFRVVFTKHYILFHLKEGMAEGNPNMEDAQTGGPGETQTGGPGETQTGGPGETQTGGPGETQTGGPGETQTGGPGETQTGGPGETQTGGPGETQTGGPGETQTGGPGETQTGGPGETQTGGPGETQTVDGQITIEINSERFVAPKRSMTGAEIKELGHGSPKHMLVLVVGTPDEMAGGDDRQISDDESITLDPTMRFRIVNPATFG